VHLRSLRQRKRLSLSDVSEATGIATSTLSRVEHNQMSLTYDKLLQLCSGLGVDFSELFNPTDAGETIHKVSGRQASTPPEGGRELQVNMQHYRYLCTQLSGKKMTPMVGTVTATTLDEAGGLRSHEGEEFSFVLEGRLELHTEFYEPLVVEVGGCIYFDSTMAHAYVSIGDVPLKFLCVSSTPEQFLTDSLMSSVQARHKKK
jgi:transcriptional regulator with XRE-family HTH domain